MKEIGRIEYPGLELPKVFGDNYRIKISDLGSCRDRVMIAEPGYGLVGYELVASIHDELILHALGDRTLTTIGAVNWLLSRQPRGELGALHGRSGHQRCSPNVFYIEEGWAISAVWLFGGWSLASCKTSDRHPWVPGARIFARAV